MSTAPIFSTNSRSFNRAAALLNALMLAALVAVSSAAIGRFANGWPTMAMTAVCFVIALEIGVIHYAMREQRPGLAELWRYLLPEMFVFAVALRLVTLPSQAALQQAMQSWLFDPLSIFDLTFIGALIIGLIVGLVAHSAMYDIAVLQPRASDKLPLRDESSERYVAIVAGERHAAIGRISRRFAIGSILLLAALSLEVVSFERFGGAALPISTLSAVAAIVYLVAGFLLYSRARLALMESRWYLEGSHVAPAVGKLWIRGSFLLVLGVIGAAALLPRNYGMGLIDALRQILGTLGYGIMVVGYFVSYLFGLLLMIPALLLSFLAPKDTGSLPQAAPLAIPPLPAEIAQREPPLWPAIIFWLCILILVIHAMRIMLRRHPALLSFKSGWLGRLRTWLLGFWQETSTWFTLAAETLRSSLSQSAPTQPAARRLRLAALSPVERIAYYYHATIRRASQRGIGRTASQTPDEYRKRLAADIPESQPDIDQLTEAYVRARYTAGPISDSDVQRVRPPFERLRRLLRK